VSSAGSASQRTIQSPPSGFPLDCIAALNGDRERSSISSMIVVSSLAPPGRRLRMGEGDDSVVSLVQKDDVINHRSWGRWEEQTCLITGKRARRNNLSVIRSRQRRRRRRWRRHGGTHLQSRAPERKRSFTYTRRLERLTGTRVVHCRTTTSVHIFYHNLLGTSLRAQRIDDKLQLSRPRSLSGGHLPISGGSEKYQPHELKVSLSHF